MHSSSPEIPRTFIDMQRRLSAQNLSDLSPNPVAYVLFSSHPTGPERIAQARDFAVRNGIEAREWSMSRTLIVTNDFPPRPGGIQAFVQQLAVRQPPGQVVVYAPAWEGAAEFDAEQPFRVVRHPTSLMLPVPDVARRAAELVRAEGCDTRLVRRGRTARAARPGAAPARAPAGSSRRPTATRSAGRSSPALGRCCGGSRDGVDVVTYLGEYTRRRLGRGGRRARASCCGCRPGWTPKTFHPDVDGAADPGRARPGRPAGRRVRLAAGAAQGPGHADPCAAARSAGGCRTRRCCIVSGGRTRHACSGWRCSVGVADDVVFTGSVPWEDLPRYYAAGDVFAMPCRTRRGGLDVEGLGIVYLEASATGLPVVAGDSGGAPDAVVDGETGYVVDGRDVAPDRRPDRRPAGRSGAGRPDGRGRPGLGGGGVALGRHSPPG